MNKKIYTLILFLSFVFSLVGQQNYKSITWEKFKKSGPDLK